MESVHQGTQHLEVRGSTWTGRRVAKEGRDVRSCGVCKNDDDKSYNTIMIYTLQDAFTPIRPIWSQSSNIKKYFKHR